MGGRMGGACQAIADGRNKDYLTQAMWPETPTHLYLDSQLCERKMFSASLVPQPVENHT